MEDLTGLAEFLVAAKRSTYASNAPGRREKDHSTTQAYEEGDWSYKDQFFGSGNFIGHETVWRRKKPVWGMNYHGVRLDTLFEEERLFAFLREALQRIDAAKPFRGPDNYQSGDLTYMNFATGDLANFRGVEFIYQTGRTLYQLDYHGGLISQSDE